jgi:hypothetical protein
MHRCAQQQHIELNSRNLSNLVRARQRDYLPNPLVETPHLVKIGLNKSLYRIYEGILCILVRTAITFGKNLTLNQTMRVRFMPRGLIIKPRVKQNVSRKIP